MDDRSEVRVEEQKKKWSWLKKAAVGIVCCLVVLIALAAGYINSKLSLVNYSDGKTSAPYIADAAGDEDEEEIVDISGLEQVEPTELPDIEILTDNNVFNILLLGTDDRDLELSDSARADSIMLMSLNFADRSGKLVSFERGTGVPIVDGQYEGLYDWLTHCFRWGGADLMVTEIRECFKVDVDRYVRVNLNALIKVIDTLGGVDVELTQLEAWALNSQATGGIYRGEGTSQLQSNLVEGTNHLTGVTAVAFARLRSIDSDWHRIVRQRTVLQACADALRSADLLTLNRICDEVLPLVQTNLTQREIIALLFKAPGMLGIVFDQMTIPAEGTYGGMTAMTPRKERGMFWPDFELNTQILQEFLYGENAA